MSAANPATPPSARPSMLSLNIREKSALYAAFMPHLKNGGIFIPTGRIYQLGDEVYMLLSLLDDPAKMPVAGRVVWITPKDAHGGKQQGVGVEFSADEAGLSARRKIEILLGNALGSTRQTHTL